MGLESFAKGGVAVVVGASGGIGSALVRGLDASGRFRTVIALSRDSHPPLDLTREETIRDAAAHVAGIGAPSLVIVATGLLHRAGMEPERTYRALTAENMAMSFAINALGPALVLKHMLPLVPKRERAVVAVLSAKLGSISDNRLGGWYSYRASKAALNQIIRTAAVELGRTHPKAACVAIHPGTVATNLTEGFAKTGLHIQMPDQAAEAILTLLDRITTSQSGAFLDRKGSELPA